MLVWAHGMQLALTDGRQYEGVIAKHEILEQYMMYHEQAVEWERVRTAEQVD